MFKNFFLSSVLISIFFSTPLILANAPPPIPFPIPPSTTPNPGISSHQIYSARSPDGLTWKKDGVLLFDHASVPDAVMKDGKIYLYFMDASEGPDHMSVAISKDEGKTWEKKRVEFTQRFLPAVDPNPILTQDGKIRLFYLAPQKPAHLTPYYQDAIHEIHSALSSDGIHFIKEEGIRFSYNRITDPDVIETQQGWKMLVSQGPINVLATSPDGKTFKREGKAASGTGAVSRTIKINDLYRMYKCNHGWITSQSTQDWVNWTEEGIRLEPKAKHMVCDPGIVQLKDGTYLMFYKEAPLSQK